MMENWKIACLDNDYPEKWLNDMKEANEMLASHRYGIEPKLMGKPGQSSKDHYASIDWKKLIVWAEFNKSIPDFKKAMLQNGFNTSMSDRLKEIENELNRV